MSIGWSASCCASTRCARRLGGAGDGAALVGRRHTVKTLLGQTDAARADAAAGAGVDRSEPSSAPQRAGAELQAMFVALASVDAAAARRHMEQAAQRAAPRQRLRPHDLRAPARHAGAARRRRADRPAPDARRGGQRARQRLSDARAHRADRQRAGRRAQRRACRSAAALDQVFAHPMFAACRWHHWVGGCVAAYAALLRDDEAGVLQHLRAALRVARECGYRHGPMLFLCGDMMSRLCAFALLHGVEPDIARDIAVRNQLKAPPQADGSWPWAVRVRALGALEVEIGGDADGLVTQGKPPPARTARRARRAWQHARGARRDRRRAVARRRRRRRAQRARQRAAPLAQDTRRRRPHRLAPGCAGAQSAALLDRRRRARTALDRHRRRRGAATASARAAAAPALRCALAAERNAADRRCPARGAAAAGATQRNLYPISKRQRGKLRHTLPLGDP